MDRHKRAIRANTISIKCHIDSTRFLIEPSKKAMKIFLKEEKPLHICKRPSNPRIANWNDKEALKLERLDQEKFTFCAILYLENELK